MANHSHDIRAIPHGHVLSDYKFEEVLGQGSFGITYLATDTMLQATLMTEIISSGD